MKTPATARSVIVFDGECNLCNGTVRFVIPRDKRGRFRFAPLQSRAGEELLKRHGLDAAALQSVVLVENGRAFTRSTAVLRAARHLPGLWPLLGVLALVPRPLRDVIYNFVARHRYRLWGKTSSCALPSPDVRSRFLT